MATEGKALLVKFPESLRKPIRAAAGLTDISASEFVREAVREKLDKMNLSSFRSFDFE